MGIKTGDRAAIGWLNGGNLNILRKRKDSEGIIKIDKTHAIKVPDNVQPRLIKLMDIIPFPPFIKMRWYPFYFASPEFALNLELTLQQHAKPKTFGIRDSIQPILLEKKQKFSIAEAIPMAIKPTKPEIIKKGNENQFKYGLETMTSENLSTFLEGKQESMLQRVKTDKFNMLMFIILGAVIGFLLGNVMPITSATGMTP